MDTGIFPEKEFRKITVKMIQDLRNTMEKMQEMLSKVLEELKNNQIEMNNTLEGINSRIMEADGEGNEWYPTPVLLPGKSHGWRSLVGYSSWGC